MNGRRLLAVLVVTSVLAVPTRARADAAPMIVFVGPAEPGPKVVAARQALESLARRVGTAMLDLSAKPPVPSRARGQLRRGIDAYLAFKYDDALKAFDAGAAESSRTGASGLTATELSDLFLYRALALTQKGDATRAWEDFLRAAVVDPTRRLDPVRFPPSASESFTRAAKAVAAGTQTLLTVSAPAACRVTVDARAVTTGAAVKVPEGEHFVRVACPTTVAFGAKVVVRGAAHAVKPTLRPVAVAGPQTAARAARGRNASTLLYARVAVASRGPTTLGVRLLDSATGREKGRVVSRIDRARGIDDIIAGAQRLIDQVVKPPPPIVVVRERPWYRRPWVWGLAGAAVATAVILPFALRSDQPSGFDLTLGGALP